MKNKSTIVKPTEKPSGTAAAIAREESTIVSHCLSNLIRNTTIVVQPFFSPPLIYPEARNPSQQVQSPIQWISARDSLDSFEDHPSDLTAQMSNEAFGAIWNTPEENEAWKHL